MTVPSCKSTYILLFSSLSLLISIYSHIFFQADTLKTKNQQREISYEIDGTLQLIQLGNGKILAVCSGEKTDCTILKEKPLKKTQKTTSDSVHLNNH